MFQCLLKSEHSREEEEKKERERMIERTRGGCVSKIDGETSGRSTSAEHTQVDMDKEMQRKRETKKQELMYTMLISH